MEVILHYLERVGETLGVGFLLYLPFLMNRYLKASQERMQKKQ
jgi:hypothetical protein